MTTHRATNADCGQPTAHRYLVTVEVQTSEERLPAEVGDEIASALDHGLMSVEYTAFSVKRVKSDSRRCSSCNETIPDGQGWVLYDNPLAAQMKDKGARTIVCAPCLPNDSIRSSAFAFARTSR